MGTPVWKPQFQKPESTWSPKGAAKGSWGVPTWSPKGFGGKDFGGKGFGKGFGKGKGKGKSLKSFKNDVKVWIGNIPEDVTWKELQEHMDQAGKTKWVEVFTGKGKGTAAVAYSSTEEAAAAIAALNGSVLNDTAIVCDYWEKQPKA